MKSKITYKDSGVDIKVGNDFVAKIQRDIKKTLNSNVIGKTTSFAALYSITKEKIKNPVLVSCTDGVGTKIELGIKTNKLRGLGIDLVAMSINDLICTGAKPLFFLDYLATSKLKVNYHAEVIKGIVEGCILSSTGFGGSRSISISPTPIIVVNPASGSSQLIFGCSNFTSSHFSSATVATVRVSSTTVSTWK